MSGTDNRLIFYVRIAHCTLCGQARRIEAAAPGILLDLAVRRAERGFFCDGHLPPSPRP